MGGNTCHLLGVIDKILMHAEIKHYTNIGIHHDYTLAITVIRTIRFTERNIIENSKGVVHAYVDQKLVKSNKITSFI